MIKFLLSPTESDLSDQLKDDAISSPLPEEHGADILIYSKHGLYGAQRKKLPHDFILSYQDGRLSRETSLMPKTLKFYELINEGRFRYYPNGQLAVDRKEPSRFTKRQIAGILFNIKYIKGVPIEYTDDIESTADYLRWMYQDLNDDTHLGLYDRPSLKGAWYVPTVNELHLWIMQSWPGIGPATADAILKHFGRIPLKWTCTLSELMSVPRLGKKNAHEMYESLAEMSEQQDRARDIVTSSVERHTADLTTLPESNEFDVMREMLRYGRRGY